MKKTKKTDRAFESVWKIVQRVPRGRVVTYGTVSALIGGRLTPVGVGWAIPAAPDGSVPWHRVVSGKGTISTDDEHPGLQRAMLESEGVVFDRQGRIDFDRFGWPPRTTRARPPAGAERASLRRRQLRLPARRPDR
jgi:methylated-DNA-protein-cysteine methyltransferase-like protein